MKFVTSGDVDDVPTTRRAVPRSRGRARWRRGRGADRARMLGLLRRARRRRVQRLSRARRRRGHLDGLRQRHVREPAASTSIPADLTAVVITHAHPDHCVDIYGLHVMYRYGLERSGLPVYAPEGVEKTLEGLVGESDRHVRLAARRRRRPRHDRRRARCGSRAPTIRRPRSRSSSRTAASGSCTPPTPDRSGASRRSGPGADLVLSEATYQHDDIRVADPPLGAPGRRGGARGEGAPADAHPLVADARPGSLRRRRPPRRSGARSRSRRPHLSTHV